MTDGTDGSDGRVPAAQDAMKKTPEELVTWAVQRTHDDSLRQSIVQLEFARRSAAAQDRAADAAKEAAEYTKANARYMLWSVIVLALSAVITAAATIFSAWLANQSTP
jgi:hypothetical protein